MVNIPYRTATMQGRAIRSVYKATLPVRVALPIQQDIKLRLSVYSFSCERDLPEQVASIRSFIRFVGIPDKFTVISDGSYSLESQRLLCRINPCVNIVYWKDLLTNIIPQPVIAYANDHPMGKKLAILMSLPVTQATIYADSDILFFPGANEIRDLVNSNNYQTRYLPDCCVALDNRFLLKEEYSYTPVNGGFLLITRPLNWNLAIERILTRQETPNYFTEQTMVHLTMHNNQACPFDVNKYVLKLDDQLIYQDKYACNNIVLRHYVTPVRYKFWLNVRI